ncbi:MAG: hypothetical protein P8Z40_16600 [Chloroflexota bacterium]|jgi:transposase
MEPRYIIRSDVDKDQMNTLEAAKAYKSMTFLERAFRNLKTVQLEIRPVYHKNDERIRSHVFLCMLAYYLQCNRSDPPRNPALDNRNSLIFGCPAVSLGRGV